MENFLGGFIGTVGFLILILIFKNLAEYIKKKIFRKNYNSIENILIININQLLKFIMTVQ